jgi:hypothetical protein
MQLFKSANLPVQSLKQGRKICHGSLTHPQDMSEYHEGEGEGTVYFHFLSFLVVLPFGIYKVFVFDI